MTCILHRSRTVKLMRFHIPTELIQLIFQIWLGTDYASISFSELGYRVCKYDFTEGVDLFLRCFHDQPFVLNQMLYGAASISNIPMTLQLRHRGSTDIVTAINIALENGHLEYVRTFMYLERIPRVPLSIYRWLYRSN